jgi:hypothetical protein
MPTVCRINRFTHATPTKETKMQVRAKFKVTSVTEQEGGLKTVSLQPVTSGSTENESFFKYTPSGNIQLGVMNPTASAQFTPGKQFYVDFNPAK